MNDREQRQFRKRLEELRDALPGLRIDTQLHWEVTGIKEPEKFFRHLPMLLGAKSVLYVEGLFIHPEAATLYTKHETDDPIAVDCDTIFPVPDTYHLNFSRELAEGLIDLIQTRPVNELFLHLKGYQDGQLIFGFHDAFTGALVISDRVGEVVVEDFCRALGVPYSQKPTETNSNMYRDLLYLMEHPEAIKGLKVPWWRKKFDEFVAGFREGWKKDEVD